MNEPTLEPVEKPQTRSDTIANAAGVSIRDSRGDGSAYFPCDFSSAAKFLCSFCSLGGMVYWQ